MVKKDIIENINELDFDAFDYIKTDDDKAGIVYFAIFHMNINIPKDIKHLIYNPNKEKYVKAFELIDKNIINEAFKIATINKINYSYDNLSIGNIYKELEGDNNDYLYQSYLNLVNILFGEDVIKKADELKEKLVYTQDEFVKFRKAEHPFIKIIEHPRKRRRVEVNKDEKSSNGIGVDDIDISLIHPIGSINVLNSNLLININNKILEKEFNGDELAKNVFDTKYATEGLYFSTPSLMAKVISIQLYIEEEKYPNPTPYAEILRLVSNFKYLIPGGSILYGLNNPKSLSSLSNCFVIGNEDDSYGGILTTDQEQVHIMKRRGGVGHDLSHIRPKHSKINNVAKTSTGIVPFMERYSNSTREVAQGGRRGALMLSIDCDHPDVSDFISAKHDIKKITGANISVRVKDEVMDNYCNFIYDNSIIKKIVKSAHKSAEPGVLFWDKIISESPADCYSDEGFKTTSTNPCGEIPLSPYDACRLMSLNMYSYVKNPFTKNAEFDYELFVHDVKIAQRMIDNIIDIEEKKILSIIEKVKLDPQSIESKLIEFNLWKKILSATKKGRRTGLGVTGVADMFAALNIKYGDPEKAFIVEDIFREFSVAAYASSITMAKERGAFPVFNKEKERDNPFINRVVDSILASPFHDGENIIRDFNSYGRRNISLLTIAPNGSISIEAGVSNGIENVFEISYFRRKKVSGIEKGYAKKNITVDENGDSWVKYRVFHNKFKEWMSITKATDKDIKNLSDKEIKELYAKSPYNGTIVKDINPIEKVRLQGMVQKYIDHAISNTCNMPKDATLNDVSDVIKEAWKSGCKGVTIYRDGSREGVLVNNDDIDLFTEERPKSIKAFMNNVVINGLKTIVLTGLLKDKPYEVFILDYNKLHNDYGEYINLKQKKVEIIKRANKFYSILFNEGLKSKNILDYTIQDNGKFSTRLISLMLRKGVSPDEMIEQIDKSDDSITNMYKVIARVLKTRFKINPSVSLKCPDCGEEMTIEGGCSTCYNCGYSKCG